MDLSVPLKSIFSHAVPQETGEKIAALYSRIFAEQASGTIFVAVDRSAYNSYFRRHELRTIMENPAIDRVARLNPLHPAAADQPRPKTKWYESQHLHWLNDARDRLKTARADFVRDKSEKTAGRYEQALIEMTAELIISLEALPRSRTIARKTDEIIRSETDLAAVPRNYLEKLGNVLLKPFVQIT
jgi:hypothetical protein